jgi:hypothetical protein
VNPRELAGVRAIDRPAEVVGVQLEPGLTERILRDVADEPGGLPLLSHALRETWKRREGRMLTAAGYAAAGGVSGAIAQTAETVYGGLSTADQAIARNLFVRLTELGEGTDDTRRRVAFAEVVHDGATGESVRSVITRLADARLLTTSADSVEVAHEALIREWPRLREWLDDDREGLRLLRHLTESAQAWERLGRDEGELYRGARLSAAESLERTKPELNPLEREFLDASRELPSARIGRRGRASVGCVCWRRSRARSLSSRRLSAERRPFSGEMPTTRRTRPRPSAPLLRRRSNGPTPPSPRPSLPAWKRRFRSC